MLPIGIVIVAMTKPSCFCLATLVRCQRSKPATAGLPSSATTGLGSSGAIWVRVAMSYGSLAQSFASSSLIFSMKAGAPILCSRNLMRALLRFLRSRPGRSPSRSKMRRIASETRMYSPSSSGANSQTVSARRGMVEVPPPTRSSKPYSFCPLAPVRSRAMKPRSWKLEPALSAPLLENEVLNLRGKRWQIGLRSMLRA